MEKKDAPSSKDFLEWFLLDTKENFDNLIFKAINENIFAKINQYKKETKDREFYTNNITGLCEEAVVLFKENFLKDELN